MGTQLRASRRTGVMGSSLLTGHSRLDELTGGLGPGELWVVRGRRDLRRALSAELAWTAVTSGAPVLWVSLLETPEDLAERSRQAAAGRTAPGVHLELRTSGSLTPVHRPGGDPFRVVILDDPDAEAHATVTFLGLQLPRGGALEVPLRLYAARARATVLVTGSSARLFRWGPDVEVCLPDPSPGHSRHSPSHSPGHSLHASSARREAEVAVAGRSRSLVPLTP